MSVHDLSASAPDDAGATISAAGPISLLPFVGTIPSSGLTRRDSRVSFLEVCA